MGTRYCIFALAFPTTLQDGVTLNGALIDVAQVAQFRHDAWSYVQSGASQAGGEVIASRPEVPLVLVADHLQNQLSGCLENEQRTSVSQPKHFTLY